MPWRSRNRECEQSDGSKGSYVIEKKTSSGWKQTQCFKSKEERDQILAFLRSREDE